MEQGRLYFLAFWRWPFAEVLLMFAAVLHLGLAFRSLRRRRSLKMPYWEAMQMVLGFLIPPLLALHIIATLGGNNIYSIQDTYFYVLSALWVSNFFSLGLMQVATILIAWIHGCIGLHYWLRLKPGYARWQNATLIAAILLPLLALIGFMKAGQEVETISFNPALLSQIAKAQNFPTAAIAENFYLWAQNFVYFYLLALLLVFAHRILRNVRLKKHLIALTYTSGDRISVPQDTTLLEASRMGNIPHASVCGGRGRCSTCRVRILEHPENLSPIGESEAHLLLRLKAPMDTRLACQARLIGPATIQLLLPPNVGASAAIDRASGQSGSEQELAVLFADLRNFTQFAEHRLPYDVVFLLNRYFRAMGEVIEAGGGHIDKFIGDGIMALFGIEKDGNNPARQAAFTAEAMLARMTQLNHELAHDLKEPLQIGIGVHFGSVILGEMGYGKTNSVTAIGDSVNVAARLENATKELGTPIVFSEALIQTAGLVSKSWPRHEIQLRGRQSVISAYAVASLGEENSA